MNLARDRCSQLSAIPRGIAVFDPYGAVRFVSAQFLSLFPSLKPGRWNYADYVEVLSCGVMKQALRASLAEGDMPSEGYVTLSDGRTLHFQHESLIDECPGFMCQVEDVSDRLNEIRISHVLRSLAENTVDSIGMADTEHRGFFINKRMADTLGVDPARLEEDVVFIEDVQPYGIGPYRVAEALEVARDRGALITEARVYNLRSREENIVSQVITAHIDLIEDRPIYSTILRDISELHRYRQKLEETNQKLEAMLGRSESELQQRTKEVQYSRQLWRSIVEHQLNLVVIATEHGEILFANRLVEGVGGQALCGRQLVELVEPEYRKDFKRRFENMLLEEDEITTFEATFLLAEGVRFNGLASLNSFERLDGERVVTMLVADITESLRDRERLLESQKFAATGRMAAKLAHEINNPLAGIKSALSIIQNDLSPEAPSANYLKLSMSELDRVGLIIKQLYGLYRPNQDPVKSLKLDALVTDCIMLLDARLGAKGITVSVRGGRNAEVMGADNSLRQVLFNVLGNALEACDHGGDIAVRILRQGPFITLAVRDSGMGLGGIEEKSVYEPFFSTKQAQDGGGLGLGMAVSRGLMRGMDGEIRIRNRRIGRGALCVLFLPAASKEG